MFEPKKYQKETLKALSQFLEISRFSNSPKAFTETCVAFDSKPRHPYQPLPELEEIPYVCLRLPTGGGKTYLAALTVPLAARTYLGQDFPLVLWLVPTNVIRTQTLETLQNTRHPNREALDQAFGGQVMVLDIIDFDQIRPQDIHTKAIIIIGTFATLRVNSTEGRRVYAHNEALEPHFVNVPANTLHMERIEEGADQGQIKYSFRNLLALSQPLVIVDEAHNNASPLSIEVLQRIQPACIIEYTATPADNSNILYYVSASQLKAEHMIKLPIILTEHKTWQEAIEASLDTRQRLNDLALSDSEFIHPIVLFQAEEHGNEVTFDVIRNYLLEQCQIAPERIAVATGNQRELDGVNLLDPQNKVEFVITVEALKEGWDCPFAYVFCSVARVHSTKDVEQLLGRVLRMPFAKRRSQEALNRAYAHVSTLTWPQAVIKLTDRLVEMGFDQQEAAQAVQPVQLHLPETELSATVIPQESFTITLSGEPALLYLTTEELAQISIHRITEGQVQIEVKGEVDFNLEQKLIDAVPTADRLMLKKTISFYRIQRPHTPAQKGIAFEIPELCLFADGQWEPIRQEFYLDTGGWNLLDYPAELNESEFSIIEKAESYEIDLNGERLTYKDLGSKSSLNLKNVETGWNLALLIRWLDDRLYQPDIRHEVLVEFFRRTIQYLNKDRKISFNLLVRGRTVLEKALRYKIEEYREDAFNKGYQKALFDGGYSVETRFDYSFIFPPAIYPAHWHYEGHFQFSKHYYPLIGELESSGEEFECAQAIDRCIAVKHWVRNLANQPEFSFRFPLANGFFYPDFIVELNDGRILIVEYKGAHLIEHDEPKNLIGQLWEEHSQGKGLFLLAVAKDEHGQDVYRQIEEKVNR